MNMLNVRITALIVDVFSVAKILAMLFIMGLGVWQLIVGGIYYRTIEYMSVLSVVYIIIDHIDNFKNAFEGTTTCVGDIVMALYFVIYSYDGW